MSVPDAVRGALAVLGPGAISLAGALGVEGHSVLGDASGAPGVPPWHRPARRGRRAHGRPDAAKHPRRGSDSNWLIR